MPSSAKKTKTKKKKTEGSEKKQNANGASTSATGSQQAKEFPLLQFALILLFTVFIPQAMRFKQFGITALTGHAYWDLTKTALEWKELLEKDKTILTIGGAHRSGTTLIWECISNHPEITGFGNEFHSGVSFSEGVLLQQVLPNFGVATELAIKNKQGYKELMVGVGKYALAEEDTVHLTEQNEIITADNMAKLLNRYGAYWNLTKNVWLDKSPPAAVMSRAFQGFYNIDVQGFTSSRSTSPAKFLFTTRHPIANAYGHHHLLGGSHVVPFDMLLQNYVKVHEYLNEDMPHLQNDPKLIKLEDFVLDPAKYLTDIFTWLGVDASEETVASVLKQVRVIKKDVNAKYRKKWCSIDFFKRGKVEKKYQPIVESLGLDYDLVGWCNDK